MVAKWHETVAILSFFPYNMQGLNWCSYDMKGGISFTQEPCILNNLKCWLNDMKRCHGCFSKLCPYYKYDLKWWPNNIKWWMFFYKRIFYEIVAKWHENVAILLFIFPITCKAWIGVHMTWMKGSPLHINLVLWMIWNGGKMTWKCDWFSYICVLTIYMTWNGG